MSYSIVEIFDSLGSELDFLQVYMKISAIYEFNTTPVQCSGSRICGPFVLYFIIYRFFNLDLHLIDFLNIFFEENCTANETAVNLFIENLK